MDWTQPKVYAVKHKNEQTRSASQSGGVFTALSDEMLKENGVIYGCILTSDFQAVHIRAQDSKIRDLMRGSKYVQSRLGDIFADVRDDLGAGRSVLFSGTSCQVAGLRSFLGKEYPKLFCVDIVCHGVPSPAVWKKYLSWQEQKNFGKVVSADFRNKKDFGWRAHVETLKLNNGKTVNSRIFAALFKGHNIMRPSCYECPYKNIIHPGDITIGDYWGIKKAASEFDDNKGVSLVLINNDNGAKIFEQVKENLIWKPTRIEDSLQSPLLCSEIRPIGRKRFWADFYSVSFDLIVKKYSGVSFKDKVERKLGRIIRKIRKRYLIRQVFREK